MALYAFAAVVFIMFGPLFIAASRHDANLPLGWVFAGTVLSIPTVMGWPVILAYALFGKR